MPAEYRFIRLDLRAFVRPVTATLTALMMWGLVAHAAEPVSTGVLILHSNQRTTPAAIAIEETLRRVVPAGYPNPVELYSEYLDDEWRSVHDFGGVEAEFLKTKYASRNIRVIVASALPALQFMLEYRDRMLPGVPVVHLVVARDVLAQMSLPPDFVGKAVDLDPTPTLKLALRLHPDARQLVFVVGTSARDRAWEGRLRQAAPNLDPSLEVNYFAGLPTSDLLQQLHGLPRDALVFTPGYFADGAGKVFVPRQSAEAIAQASPVPVYGPLDTFVGSGVVGGYVTPSDAQATEAGALVVGLLNFKSIALPPQSSVAAVPMVDWRQVRRWGIDTRLLPDGTLVKFREPTVWDKYWREISLALAIFVIQLGLISSLLIERQLRLRTAAALAESEQQLTLAARAARLSTWVWEVTRNKLRSSSRFRHRHARPKAPPVRYDQVLEAVHPADRAEVDRAVRDALTKGEELDIEYRVMQPGGEVRWVAARGRAEKDGERLLGVALDITERKLAELRAVEDRAALRRMMRVSLLGQLSASIAHQLNQPLAAILGNAEAAQKMLGRERVDLAELRNICDDIVTEDNRAAEVIRRLRALYKRGDMKTEPLDVNELIGETLDLLRAELLTRNVVPRSDLAPGPLMVDGGRVQLQQVLLNLILNAADAMTGIDAGARSLTIRSESAGAGVRLSVADNGTGIAADDLKHVFDAFWSTKPGGMGIGLAVCQSIVAAHRGRITAANNREGGATFSFTLPVRHPA